MSPLRWHRASAWRCGSSAALSFSLSTISNLADAKVLTPFTLQVFGNGMLAQSAACDWAVVGFRVCAALPLYLGSTLDPSS